MALNGLLLLTSSTRTVTSRSRVNLLCAKKILEVIDNKRVTALSSTISPVLYVVQWSSDTNEVIKGQQICGLSSRLYSQGNTHCPNIDIRFLPNNGLQSRPNVPIDLVLVEGSPTRLSLATIRSFVNEWFRVSKPDYPVQYLKEESVSDQQIEEDEEEIPVQEDLKKYNVVALGGTFDRMHNAHKILLTEAVLRCSKEIIVGVTSDEMIKSKLLFELIEGCETRVERVKKFLEDVAPHLKHRVVEINDPFGPTITEKDIGLIVVSAETIKGAEKINQIRESKSFPQLDVHHIVLFNDSLKQSEYEEDKISSSSQRIRILGDRLHPPRKSPSVPYIIGLTGGIASGKSTLCVYLETLGLPTINCDQLGHEAYKKGTTCFSEIVKTFGKDVLSSDGEEINRKVLGTKVFNNPTELNKLTSIVWPEIQRLAQALIQKFSSEGHKAIVLDAAVLLEAGWDDLCHDVWVVVIPKEETISRVQARDGLSAEDAERRVKSQVSNHERVKRANFVFSSLWEIDFTRRQADKAWKDIKEIIDSL